METSDKRDQPTIFSGFALEDDTEVVITREADGVQILIHFKTGIMGVSVKATLRPGHAEDAAKVMAQWGKRDEP